MPLTVWLPERPARSIRPLGPPPWPVPDLSTAMLRGFAGRCPACGQTHLFRGYLRVVTECTQCGAPLGRARADDAPPYFTILLVGHILIPMILILQREQTLSTLLLTAIFLPLSAALTLFLLRPVKGGTVGLMLHLDLLRDIPDA